MAHSRRVSVLVISLAFASVAPTTALAESCLDANWRGVALQKELSPLGCPSPGFVPIFVGYIMDIELDRVGVRRANGAPCVTETGFGPVTEYPDRVRRALGDPSSNTVFTFGQNSRQVGVTFACKQRLNQLAASVLTPATAVPDPKRTPNPQPAGAKSQPEWFKAYHTEFGDLNAEYIRVNKEYPGDGDAAQVYYYYEQKKLELLQSWKARMPADAYNTNLKHQLQNVAIAKKDCGYALHRACTPVMPTQASTTPAAPHLSDDQKVLNEMLQQQKAAKDEELRLYKAHLQEQASRPDALTVTVATENRIPGFQIKNNTDIKMNFTISFTYLEYDKVQPRLPTSFVVSELETIFLPVPYDLNAAPLWRIDDVQTKWWSFYQ